MGRHDLAETTVHTADVAVFTTRGEWTYALLVRRRYTPDAGCWALPGGHLDPGETPLSAAVRELAEETGLHLNAAQLVYVGVYDEPGRDPRGRYSSTAYTARLDHAPAVQGGDDAEQAAWVCCQELSELHAPLAFDHGDILADAWLAVRRPDEVDD